MKKLLLAALAFVVPSLAFGQEAPDGVPDGSQWTGGDATITVNVSSNPTVNTVDISVTYGDGTSTPQIGTPGADSSSANPTCSGSPSCNVGGMSFRAKGEKMQRKVTRDDGTSAWVNMRKVKKKDDARPAPGIQTRSAGGTDEVVSLPH